MRGRRGFRGSSGLSLFKSLTRVVNINGEIRANGKKCNSCKICEKTCPTGAIQVDSNNKKWYYFPRKCIKCYLCVDKCPQKAIMVFP